VLIIIIGHYLWLLHHALMNIYNCVHTDWLPTVYMCVITAREEGKAAAAASATPDVTMKYEKYAQDYSVIIIPSMATDLIHSIIHQR
jgi:hypothetical protein